MRAADLHVSTAKSEIKGQQESCWALCKQLLSKTAGAGSSQFISTLTVAELNLRLSFLGFKHRRNSPLIQTSANLRNFLSNSVASFHLQVIMLNTELSLLILYLTLMQNLYKSSTCDPTD